MKTVARLNIAGALKTIVKNLEHNDINWAVIASGALALHGLDIEPMDVDIMTDEYGLFKINRLLGNYTISLSGHNPSAIFDSTMSKFCINNCSIEVMSNFKIKSQSSDMWHDMNYLLQSCAMINLEDVKVPVLPLLQLIELYTLMGRDKDMIKIKKIEHYLSNHSS